MLFIGHQSSLNTPGGGHYPPHFSSGVNRGQDRSTCSWSLDQAPPSTACHLLHHQPWKMHGLRGSHVSHAQKYTWTQVRGGASSGKTQVRTLPPACPSHLTLPCPWTRDTLHQPCALSMVGRYGEEREPSAANPEPFLVF